MTILLLWYVGYVVWECSHPQVEYLLAYLGVRSETPCRVILGELQSIIFLYMTPSTPLEMQWKCWCCISFTLVLLVTMYCCVECFKSFPTSLSCHVVVTHFQGVSTYAHCKTTVLYVHLYDVQTLPRIHGLRNRKDCVIFCNPHT